MCTSPFLIRNRKYKDINVKLRSSYISVPCGQCDECLASLANDLYVRARYEYMDCLRTGGTAFMCCLTYDDSTLPYFEHLGKRYMVFNKKHIIDFLKRLRTKLDRFYIKHFNRSAPDFKYLITCEYGTDPTKTHRPHYHMLFFFSEPIRHNTFRSVFASSIYRRVGKSLERVFGWIYQCDYLDSAAGIKYAGKYILKDLMYEPQRKAIINLIKFKTEYVNNLFNIRTCVETPDDEFFNKCVRQTKEYRNAVALYVRPYRHMLQFYMLSNDLGISSIVNRYGENIVNMSCLNLEGFVFKFPKLVKQRIEQNYGSAKSDELSKQIFINYLKRATDDLVRCERLSSAERFDLLDFASKYVQPFSGTLYLVNPSGVDIRSHLDTGESLDFDDLFNDYNIFYDNGFFSIRERLYRVLALYDTFEFRFYRASLAKQKRVKQVSNYERRKRNKPVKLF